MRPELGHSVYLPQTLNPELGMRRNNVECSLMVMAAAAASSLWRKEDEYTAKALCSGRGRGRGSKHVPSTFPL